MELCHVSSRRYKDGFQNGGSLREAYHQIGLPAAPKGLSPCGIIFWRKSRQVNPARAA